MSHNEITLRELRPTDGPALQRLNREAPDTGAVRLYSQFIHDPYETLDALHPGFVGVVAEAEGYDGLVGRGLINFGECQFEMEVLPFGYMNSLSVHPDYRQRGIASRLALWRVEAICRRFADEGREGMIYAGIQGGNTGSFKTAVKWSNARIDGHSLVTVKSMVSRAPKAKEGIEIRSAMDSEFEEIVERQNAFYREYNLYEPETAEGLRVWRRETVMGHRLRDYLVAVDRAGNIQAGMSLMARGELIEDHVVSLPRALKVANVVMKILPPGGIMKRIAAERIWCLTGKEDVARTMWETARWLWRGRGTNLMTFFDPKGALSQIVKMPPLVPKSPGSVVLRVPRPIDPRKMLYFRP